MTGFAKPITWALDLVFPKICLCCGDEGHYFCQLNQVEKPLIELFPRQNRGWYLDGIIAAASYRQDELRAAISIMKYQPVPAIAEELGRFLLNSVNSKIDWRALIVPVPLHHRRLSQRGFNQAKLLALNFDRAGWQVVDALARYRSNIPQVELTASQRKQNVKSVFVPTNEINLVKNKTVFVIDDVATTGATLNACAKILKQNHARRVFGLVVARD